MLGLDISGWLRNVKLGQVKSAYIIIQVRSGYFRLGLVK
jgi:hypothetical protein